MRKFKVLAGVLVSGLFLFTACAAQKIDESAYSSETRSADATTVTPDSTEICTGSGNQKQMGKRQGAKDGQGKKKGKGQGNGMGQGTGDPETCPNNPDNTTSGTTSI
ncbi:MAG TPA: hypothetical protein DHW82_10820 [Spirochaetia bacterium]|nr:MAG: hypothetical protein A2Y41_09630 [Spirochaetes bacterium GWB1_36_13]HCL57485.1 hypothetical protein [Spirochaetia bacterium]